MFKTKESTWSLRQRLTAFLFLLILLLWTFSAGLIYRLSEKESNELFDASLSETANLLLFLSHHEFQEIPEGSPPDFDSEMELTDRYLSFQLWDDSNRLRYKSTNAPSRPLAPLDHTGFSWQTIQHSKVRVYNHTSPDGHIRVLISDSIKHRQEISAHFLQNLLLFTLFMMPLSYLAVRAIVQRSLGSIKKAVSDVNQLEVHRIEQVTTEYLPNEIKPLVNALNMALERIQRGLNREKRFTADAAHELRTPLAAVQTNVQLLQKIRTQTNEDEGEILDDIQTAVSRCSRLITQLLTLSKSESVQAELHDWGTADAIELIHEAASTELHSAEKKGVTLTLPDMEEGPKTVTGSRIMLILLLRNLINNAIQYNHSGGQVKVEIGTSDQQTYTLAVGDDGRGIAPENRSKVFDRFYRENGHIVSGSGLGLSICQEVAKLHDTQIQISDGLNGRGVAFCFDLKKAD
ncbi:ATP-binding protein [Limnobacter sp.]|uniref:ATP-binding protein n=1 Tax=Limnobacter sp. TaxID=2003368 RepID=UPI002585C5EC|nr:ATP-binding protein [Limnobacter sp.]